LTVWRRNHLHVLSVTLKNNVMKAMSRLTIVMAVLFTAAISGITCAQEPATAGHPQPDKVFVVIKNDGTRFVGTIVSQDEREVIMDTEKIGRVAIPRHEIREIREADAGDLGQGEYLGSRSFSSRHFISTSALPLEKGEHFAAINLYGPEAYFTLADHFTLGGLTSWVGVPIVASLKYTLHAGQNVHFGLGLYGGTLSWVSFKSLGGLAYASVTIGNFNNNLTLSGGYAGVTDGEDFAGSEPLFSVGGMVRLGKSVSLVGDSFIYAGEDPVALIMPGLRFSRNEGRAFQFGLAGIVFQGEAIPFPIPVLGWFFKI
jgi:hypothetical protein